MTDILTVLYVLVGLSLLMLIYAYVEDYYDRKKTVDVEAIIIDVAVDKVQGIKRITKVEPKKVVTKKPKTTTDMIKVNGKTQVVKRDKKGHFTK